jgi:hypothetical protein
MCVDLLIEALFKPGSRLNPDHKSKYIYLLAYAASVVDTFRRAQRQNLKQDELKATISAVEKVHNICYKSPNEIITELQALYQAIRLEQPLTTFTLYPPFKQYYPLNVAFVSASDCFSPVTR